MRIMIYLTITMLGLGLGCSKKNENNIVAPPQDKNPREYTWTVDTLTYPGTFQVLMRDMWASGPEDIYIVGHSDSGPYKMHHYDGKEWRYVGLNPLWGGTIIGPIALSGIFGFAADDIWAVGSHIFRNPNPPPNFLETALIIHFDGTQWQEYELTEGNALNTIWGVSPTDVWAGGDFGTLFHYDGQEWTPVTPPRQFSYNRFAGFSSIDVYATAYEIDTVGVNSIIFPEFLSHWDGQQWTVIDSYRPIRDAEQTFGSNLSIVEDQLFSGGYGIFQKKATGWERIFYDPNTSFSSIHGDRLDNLFAAGIFGAVYHFDGNDWLKIEALDYFDLHYEAAWTDGKEAFIIGHDGRKTYIWHGQ